MKNLLIGLFTLGSISAFSNEITLNHRALNNCHNDSCYYDFFNMTQDYGNGLSLEFGNDAGENMLGAVQAVDEMGKIVDLGKKSCRKIKSSEASSRKTDPFTFLVYSDGWYKLVDEGKTTLKANEGHCYLMYKSSTRQQVILAFNVKKLEKDKSVTLDEVEVFKKSQLENAR